MKSVNAPKKIAIFGNFGTVNYGNEGTLDAMMLYLERVCPNAELMLIGTYPDVLKEKYGLPSYGMRVACGPDSSLPKKILYRLAGLPYALKKLWSADILFIPGTGLLDDTGERPHGIPFSIFCFCLAARLRGAKIAFVSVGAGPMTHPVSRWFMKMSVRMASYCSFRDELSKRFMASVGVNTDRFHVFPDIAFQLSPPLKPPAPRRPPLQVGIGLMAYDGWQPTAHERRTVYKAYLAKMSAFVRWLLEQGYTVRLIKGEDTDREAIGDLLTSLSTGELVDLTGRVIAEPMDSLNDIMRQLAQTDLAVATRYHNLVCALKVGRPVISIGYSERHQALLAATGLEEFSQHIDAFEIKKLIGHFERMVADLEGLHTKITDRTHDFLVKLKEQDEIIARTVLGYEQEGGAIRSKPGPVYDV